MSWPTTNDPRTEFATVRFTVSEAADIDWLVGHTNVKSRSAAIRNAVDRVIASERKRAAKAAKTPTPRSLADAPEE